METVLEPPQTDIVTTFPEDSFEEQASFPEVQERPEVPEVPVLSQIADLDSSDKSRKRRKQEFIKKFAISAPPIFSEFSKELWANPKEYKAAIIFSAAPKIIPSYQSHITPKNPSNSPYSNIVSKSGISSKNLAVNWGYK